MAFSPPQRLIKMSGCLFDIYLFPLVKSTPTRERNSPHRRCSATPSRPPRNFAPNLAAAAHRTHTRTHIHFNLLLLLFARAKHAPAKAAAELMQTAELTGSAQMKFGKAAAGEAVD